MQGLVAGCIKGLLAVALHCLISDAFAVLSKGCIAALIGSYNCRAAEAPAIKGSKAGLSSRCILRAY